MLQTNARQRMIDQYLQQLSGMSEARALRVSCSGDPRTGQLAGTMGEIHCVDFTPEDAAITNRAAESYTNVFTYVARRPDLQQFANGSFLLVEVAAIPWHADREWTAECFRAAARVLMPGGLLQMSLPATYINESELVDLTRRFQLQTLIADGPDASGQTTGLWRRCNMGWREELPTLAGITGVTVKKITNAERMMPVASTRGVFASVNIWAEGLPAEADLFDLEVRIGGSRAKIVSLGAPDSKDIRQILVLVPDFELTGLLPVDIFWMEERMGKPGVLRVIPPPPLVPQLVSVTVQASGTVVVLINELQDPEDFSATIDGRPAWGYENRCVDGQIPRYEIRFQLPDAVESGDRELVVRIGRRHLPPMSIAVAVPDLALG